MYFSQQRRNWMHQITVGFGAATLSSWLPRMVSATENKSQHKSVILLWMSGGPATIDMWDLKSGHENGGDFKAISTATSGIHISEHLPRLAHWTDELAIVRSMTSSEGDHGRGTHYVRTGYQPQGAIRFPAFGSIIAKEMANPEAKIPNFVSIAPTRRFGTLTGGFLGPNYAPLAIEADAAGTLTVANLDAPSRVDRDRVLSRQRKLNELNTTFEQRHQASSVVQGFQAASSRAARLMSPKAASAFDIMTESDTARDAYGQTSFGQGCLLARRLVERGVRFVEVSLDGWDTHSDNFSQVAGLSSVLDKGFATLMSDLKDRGMLESTLVVCMGEFGRTPKINGSSGRDHYPAAWSAVLAGGGIQGGQTYGSTTKDGSEVLENPVTPPDLLATVSSLLGVDPRKQNMSNVGRPIRVADPNATPIAELL
ncbi:DUF1501 domain-containing protein [Bremerella sp. JC770]|uniref:DUF1501 domain-containing protein n=1 Tax=Bremerella sp. JC770 TaxID=3232137 RepID=UPI0034576BD6